MDIYIFDRTHALESRIADPDSPFYRFYEESIPLQELYDQFQSGRPEVDSVRMAWRFSNWKSPETLIELILSQLSNINPILSSAITSALSIVLPPTPNLCRGSKLGLTKDETTPREFSRASILRPSPGSEVVIIQDFHANRIWSMYFQLQSVPRYRQPPMWDLILKIDQGDAPGLALASG